MAETGSTQVRVATPSRCTVQAPHWAMPQPNFVPVSPSVSRSTQRSGVSGATLTVSRLPLTVKLIGGMTGILISGNGDNVHSRPARGKGGVRFPNVAKRTMFLGIMTQPSQPRITYARRLGLFSATMAVMGGIIGSGVVLGAQIVAARGGGAGLTLVAWVVGGGIALTGAFCFGELGARRPEPGGGGRLCLSARGVRAAAGVSLRMGPAAGDRDRRDRGRGGHVRELHGRAARPAAKRDAAARNRRDRAALGGQLRRRQARGRDAERLHAPETRGGRGPHRSRSVVPVVCRPLPPSTVFSRAVSRCRPRAGAIRIWRLAADQLHRRGDHRAGEESATRAGAGRGGRRGGVPARERRVSARARGCWSCREHGARGRRNGAGARSRGAPPHQGRARAP